MPAWLTDAFWTLLDWLGGVLNSLFPYTIGLLPDSPFQTIVFGLDQIPAFQYLNWILPLSEIVGILRSWIFAMVAVYGAKFILRWMKIMQ